MINPKKIEQIARHIHDSIPNNIRMLGNDIEKKIRQILQTQLMRLDLICREEFDVQTKILECTREKIAFLEQRLVKLENRNIATDKKTASSISLSENQE